MIEQGSLYTGQTTKVRTARGVLPHDLPPYMIWNGDAERFLDRLPGEPLFDLVVSSPPYNIGKPYEKTVQLGKYLEWQSRILKKVVTRLKPNGSLCWQVGNYVTSENGNGRGRITPLDYLFHPIFSQLNMIMRNRIIWRFGHGLHCQRRFSGRYEVLLWYTKSDSYTFNLDDVRVDSKYPGKRSYRGPRIGQYSSNPKGKNPEDVWDVTLKKFWDDPLWDIPNVKSQHVEKTNHPCQFPVGLVERLVLALTNKDELVFDPFAGVSSAGVAAAFHKRRFWGCEVQQEYVLQGQERIDAALRGEKNFRPHDKPIYDHTKSNLSRKPTDRQ
jgi:adenine-specific DNA-methyltransferase